MLERLWRGSIRWRWAVLWCWIGAAVVAGIASGSLDSLLSSSLAVPGTGSQQAASILSDHFGDNQEGSFTLVVPASVLAPHSLPALQARIATAARFITGASATELVRGPGIVYGNIDTPLGLQQATHDTAELRSSLAMIGLGGAELTGAPALQHDLTPVLQADLRRGELIAVVVALVILLVVLGWSPAVLVPFVVALCTSALVLGVLDAIARVTLLVLYVPNLVELIGLGLAIDYSLLVVRRLREELGAGLSVEDAVLATMATAGRTVIASGSAVAVGLCVLLAIPVPFMRSLGLAGLLVPLASMLATATLMPALLALLGRRAVPSPRLAGLGERGDPTRRLSARFAAFVAHRRVALLVLALAVIAAAAAPLGWLALTPVSLSAIPDQSSSARGIELLSERVGPGAVSPIEVVIDSGRRRGAERPDVGAATLRLARLVLVDQDVLVVAIGSKPPYLDVTGRYEQMVVVPRQGLGAPATRRLVEDLRRNLVPAAGFPGAVSVSVGGAPAQGVDFLSLVYGAFPWIIALIVLVSYLVLLRVFRSALLPAIAVLLDACSVLASWGLTVVVFRFGLGADLLGLYRVPQIEGWVPVFCFAVLFGLSMDYEVFIVTRMREAVDLGLSNEDAVSTGLAATGRTVTAAALIMVGALVGLVAGQVAGLQELGVALVLGVLIDATVVRSVLLPSLMGLLGRANWWLPATLAKRWHAGGHFTTVMAKRSAPR